MIWKAVFDFRTSTWLACGRVVFVEATAAEALGLAQIAAAEEFPGGAIERLVVLPSSEHARDVFLAKKTAAALWQHNVTAGVANYRGQL